MCEKADFSAPGETRYIPSDQQALILDLAPQGVTLDVEQAKKLMGEVQRGDCLLHRDPHTNEIFRVVHVAAAVIWRWHGGRVQVLKETGMCEFDPYEESVVVRAQYAVNVRTPHFPNTSISGKRQIEPQHIEPPVGSLHREVREEAGVELPVTCYFEVLGKEVRTRPSHKYPGLTTKYAFDVFGLNVTDVSAFAIIPGTLIGPTEEEDGVAKITSFAFIDLNSWRYDEGYWPDWYHEHIFGSSRL